MGCSTAQSERRLTMTDGLHPAENRGYRELYATARQAADHWSTVASSLGSSDAASALAGGAEKARRLLGELAETTARYGLYGRPAAQALGAAIARGRLSKTLGEWIDRRAGARRGSS